MKCEVEAKRHIHTHMDACCCTSAYTAYEWYSTGGNCRKNKGRNNKVHARNICAVVSLKSIYNDTQIRQLAQRNDVYLYMIHIHTHAHWHTQVFVLPVKLHLLVPRWLWGKGVLQLFSFRCFSTTPTCQLQARLLCSCHKLLGLQYFFLTLRTSG